MKKLEEEQIISIMNTIKKEFDEIAKLCEEKVEEYGERASYFMEPATEDEILEFAAIGESFSNHPLAVAVLEKYGKIVNQDRVSNFEEVKFNVTTESLPPPIGAI